MAESLTLAFCTFNRAARLPELVAALRAQSCSIPVEILVINNNSTDNTLEVLEQLSHEDGTLLRYVTEEEQGIPYARNRALNECMDRDYMLFMDDDEIPAPGLAESAYQALKAGADVVGGKVTVKFDNGRPPWLHDELLGFLAQIDYGDQAFSIVDTSTPLWTANIAYRMSVFRRHPELRFDTRYNRLGHAVGGGSDAMMFRQFLTLPELQIHYEPKMEVFHHVEDWRLNRRYFLQLHYTAGFKQARFKGKQYQNTLLGAPRFLYSQFLKQALQWGLRSLSGGAGALRQGMNVAHTWGMIKGYRIRTSENHAHAD